MRKAASPSQGLSLLDGPEYHVTANHRHPANPHQPKAPLEGELSKICVF